MKKKLLLLITAVLLSMGSAFAQAVVIDGINYGLNGTTFTATVYAHPDYKYSGDIIIPSTVTYNATNYSVTTIAMNAFSQCPELSSIVLPNSLLYIGIGAFNNCHALTSITIPSSVVEIYMGAFNRCKALTSFNVEAGNTNYSSIDGILFNKAKTILYYYPAGKTNSSYTVPDGVTTLTQWAFGDCTALTSITLPSSVTTIGGSSPGYGYVFAYCTALAIVTNLRPVPVDISSSNNAFYGVEISACTLKVLASSIIAYEAAEVWKDFNIVGIFSVNVSANNDEYGTVIGGGYYDKNGLATLTAVPSPNYKFLNWTKNGEVISTENPYSFTVTEDVELVANFGQYLVSVSVNNDEYGTATGGGYYDENATATLTATAHTSYKFVNWTKAGTEISTDNPYSFTVTGDIELVANFEDEVGIENFEYSTIKIYPNPTTGQLKIESEELKIENVEIFDVFGKKIFSQKSLMFPETAISISHLSAGVYFVRIQTEAGEVIKKVLKE